MGISFGPVDWFLTKTPGNLVLGFLLMVIFYPIRTSKSALVLLCFFSIGLLVEWVGVNYGFPFGQYAYGENFGPKLDGVPILIGVNWAMLTLTTAAIASRISQSRSAKVFMGVSMMIALDILMEVSAPSFGYWVFDDGPMLENYLGWFGVSCLLHYIYHKTSSEGDLDISIHLYGSQVIFFAWFYVFDLFV